MNIRTSGERDCIFQAYEKNPDQHIAYTQTYRVDMVELCMSE